jgi:hypothetical protein
LCRYIKAWDESGRFEKVGVEAHVKDAAHKWAY